MIQVEGLTKEYGAHRAIDNLTFSAEPGEILGFLGPNGAGKTTTMRILTCFFPASRGRAMVAGFDCFENSLEVRKRIGYLPESVPLYRDMPVRSYLSFVAGIKGVESRAVRGAVDRVMAECGIAEVAGRQIGELSKGFRQRVGLAQSLVNDPQVLILDEPTVGLDPRQITEIRKLIKELSGKRTVILSTHILPEVSMVCNRIIIINKGKLVAVDTPENLTAHLCSSNRLALHIAGPGPEILRVLGETAGVKRIHKEPNAFPLSPENGYILEVEAGDHVRKSLPPIILQHGWDLIEMRTERMSLEEVFIQLVTREDAA